MKTFQFLSFLFLLTLSSVSLWFTSSAVSCLRDEIESLKKSMSAVTSDAERSVRASAVLFAARSNDVSSVNRELDNVYRSIDAVLFVSTNRMPRVIADSISSAVNKRLEGTEDKMILDLEVRTTRVEQEMKRWKRR